ncbi:hypothetical protein RIF29_30532 [Crotalaria pallida]|uniref:Expansin-like A2 n=1 Tax=Crotalaria pallida TaxID=3830 RepID=A0AAN9HX21_CROPI
MALFLCFFIFLFASSASACDSCVHQSKAAYFKNDSPLSSGACGYGSLALDLGNGQVAGVVPSLFKVGAGCGACFQVRCKNSTLCTKAGTRVVATDLNDSNQTDFVLSSKAFTAIAQKGQEQQIVKLGIVDIEYKRVPCDYKNHNLSVRVEESSQKPNYLAITLLYQGGQTEIVAVYVAEVGGSNWSEMKRNHGAVWDTSKVPQGPLQLWMTVVGGYDGRMIRIQKEVLPADWKNGVIYDTGVKITDIKQEGCCDDGTWP